MHTEVCIHCCWSMYILLCRGVFSHVWYWGICPAPWWGMLCAAAALLHSQKLCNMDTAAPGCGTREESCWTGLTALPDEIKWPFFRLLPLRGSSCKWVWRPGNCFHNRKGRRRKKELDDTKISPKAIINCSADLMDGISHVPDGQDWCWAACLGCRSLDSRTFGGIEMEPLPLLSYQSQWP